MITVGEFLVYWFVSGILFGWIVATILNRRDNARRSDVLSESFCNHAYHADTSVQYRENERQNMKKRTRRTFSQDEKQDIVAKVNGLVASGKQVTSACEEVGIRDQQYRVWKNAQQYRVRKKVKPSKHKRVDLSHLVSTPAAAMDTYSVAIIGMPKEIADIIKRVLG